MMRDTSLSLFASDSSPTSPSSKVAFLESSSKEGQATWPIQIWNFSSVSATASTSITVPREVPHLLQRHQTRQSVRSLHRSRRRYHTGQVLLPFGEGTAGNLWGD
jgi:hypothetical protein